MKIQILLLRNGHVHPFGFPTGLGANNINDMFLHLPEIIKRLKEKDPTNLENTFYTLGHHIDTGGPSPVRTKESFGYQSVLQFDLDHTDQSRSWEYLPIVAQIIGASPQSLVLISSGNGLHILAHLKTPIRSAKYLSETKAHYSEITYKINSALKDAGLPGKADPAVYDASRIFRLPGTLNIKQDKLTGETISKECVLLQNPGLVPLDLDVVKISGLDILTDLHISTSHLKKDYPRPDFQEVVRECRFVKWTMAKSDEVHEPQYMALVGLLGAMSPGDRVDHDEKAITAKELAQTVYDAASSSKSLQKGEFDSKWEHGIRYGAPKCGTISQNWIGGCETCPHHGKINTPLALKSEGHVSSSSNGFWVIGKNGMPLHPHYSDIAKVYLQENAYVTCEPDRIFTFEGTHYKATGQLKVKAWLEKKISYEEYIREVHRVEFLKKIFCSNVLSEANEKDLFDETVKGKLNCRNGTVDVLKGEIIPHSPTTGFRYVLPYDFEPGQVSEFFIDWLATMMQNRTELMDSVLDMMAYCLWPTYDDHVFAFLVGEGRNGKSTLLHIMQALLGRMNYSTVSMSQLGSNRFAPANLEDKLANISEESSGSDLTFEELNIIKDLSAGGDITAERKGQAHFTMRNRAKLIFSANRTPRFHESGRAIRSRLLAIPFDHTIENSDPNVESHLIAEVPKICSMLVTRIQENLKLNSGRFKVSRGGLAATNAQEKVLLAGNSAVEWAKEHIESNFDISEEAYIPCREAFERYKVWCGESNYKMMNVVNFGHAMGHIVLASKNNGSKVIKVGGKALRVYPHTRWKEEVCA